MHQPGNNNFLAVDSIHNNIIAQNPQMLQMGNYTSQYCQSQYSQFGGPPQQQAFGGLPPNLKSIENIHDTTENMTKNLADEFLGDIGNGLEDQIDGELTGLRRENEVL